MKHIWRFTDFSDFDHEESSWPAGWLQLPSPAKLQQGSLGAQ
eukprot:COSAG05_NODE_7726_length_775_cov_2.680473_1_plen_41_part_10